MSEFIEFIFGNLFLIIVIISGIIGFISNNKEEQKKRERPTRPVERKSRPEPIPMPSRREETPKRSGPEEVYTSQTEPKERSVIAQAEAISDSIEDEQQAQMERLQRKFGGVPAPPSSSEDVTDAITQNGLDLDFIKNQQLQQMENISKELSEQQKVLKKGIRGSLRNKGLINGIIMAEVLGKPRALKPYQSVTSERYKR